MRNIVSHNTPICHKSLLLYGIAPSSNIAFSLYQAAFVRNKNKVPTPLLRRLEILQRRRKNKVFVPVWLILDSYVSQSSRRIVGKPQWGRNDTNVTTISCSVTAILLSCSSVSPCKAASRFTAIRPAKIEKELWRKLIPLGPRMTTRRFIHFSRRESFKPQPTFIGLSSSLCQVKSALVLFFQAYVGVEQKERIKKPCAGVSLSLVVHEDIGDFLGSYCASFHFIFILEKKEGKRRCCRQILSLATK